MSLLERFDSLFEHLTENQPFPWQRALFVRFIGEPDSRFPRTCDIPTGLGKTSAIAVWLLALAHHARGGNARLFPRRLVYVVNRRTVVDQSTREAEHLRKALIEAPELKDVADALRGLVARTTASESPLAISTLRGQFADNAEWRDDPTRPAVVVGTVDMIGSRLLFSGYGRGFKSRPLHAAFLGQDVLLVHDEAHLEPAFQELAEAIEGEQQRFEREKGRFRVMALSATARSGVDGFSLTAEDRKHEIVMKRIGAKKGIAFHMIEDEKRVAENVADLALHEDFVESGQAILVFLLQVKDVETVADRLRKARQEVQTLTGTLRGYERDALANGDAIFARFMPHRDRKPNVVPREGTVYLVCTSAGEIGVNISADHLVCDLTPFDSMAQRFGRVNRFGEGKARIEIVSASAKRKDGDFGAACERTFGLLSKLPVRNDLSDDQQPRHDASPLALCELPPAERRAAFTPQPRILPVSDILFDAWAMTTIHEPLPGRPPVDDYLHGVSEWEPPQTQVAWRKEVELITEDRAAMYPPEDLLEDFPLKAYELLRDQTVRVFGHLEAIAARKPDCLAWIVGRDGSVATRSVSALVVVKGNKPTIDLAGCTIVLPPNAGGISKGFLKGDAEFDDAENDYDIGDRWVDEYGKQRRARVVGGPDEPKRPGMRLIRRIDLRTPPEAVEESTESADDRVWYWYVEPRSADDDGSRTARQKELLSDHLTKAGYFAEGIAGRLLDEAEASAVVLAAKWHDLGKARRVWQMSIGNRSKSEVFAKSGPGMRSMATIGYRHEFGSLIDLEEREEFAALSCDLRALILHLVAAHHGRARPHFPRHEAFDPERSDEKALQVARDVPRRFGQLQRHCGRWRLAYLESLVRAADALASQQIGAPQSNAGTPSTEAAE